MDTLTRRTLIQAGLAAASLAALPAAAATTKPLPLNPAQRADLKRLEDYLNQVTTLEARFVQFSDAQGWSEGKLHLWRPDRLRIEYDPPVPLLIVANGSTVLVFDKQVQEATYIPLDLTPAKFILQDRIRFERQAAVTGFEKGANTVKVTLVSTDAQQPGALSLGFADNPLQLVRWSVRDMRDSFTEIALVNARFGGRFDRALFDTADPSKLDNRQGRGG